MFSCEERMFVSSANIIDSNNFDTLHKSFTCIMNRIGPKIDPSGTPQIILSFIDGLGVNWGYCFYAVWG